MPSKTAIEWSEMVWGPVTGCSKVSPGCAHCYAERLTKRFAGRPGWPAQFRPWTPENAAENVVLHPERLGLPLTWRKPRRVFVNAMSDLFHEQVPDEFIAEVWEVMAQTPQHTYQVLTKRPERMRAWALRESQRWADYAAQFDGCPVVAMRKSPAAQWARKKALSPALPNVWLGVSVENQRWADERIPLLLDTPAAVRFISAEPLLGPLDLRCWLPGGQGWTDRPNLSWVICGGESAGPADRRLVERCWHDAQDDDPEWCIPSEPGHTHGARPPREFPNDVDYVGHWCPKPEALAWVRDIRNQCVVAGVPFFFKAWPMPPTKPGGPALIDGREWREMPAARGDSGG